jgi:phage-related protein
VRNLGSCEPTLQRGEKLSLPQSRPMPSIGARCHELRIVDENLNWRIVYRIEPDAIVILEVFEKKTNRTPKPVTDVCKKRIKEYEL